MKMSIWKFPGLLAAAFAVAGSTGHANTVVLSQGPYSFNVGGEFSAALTGANYVQNYAPEATYNGGFETFCIETSVDFNPGATYTWNLSQNDSLGRPLTLGAAYLYSQFASGQLTTLYYDSGATGYNYTDTATRNADAGLLQAAIWQLQWGQSYPGFDGSAGQPPITDDPFYMDAINKFGGLAAAQGASDGAYGVDVLQMWDGTTAAQNQLVYAGDGAWTVALLGAAFGGMALVEWRRRQPVLARARAAKR